MGDLESEPCRITVIVYSAKDLQGHKKGDVCHASVVFGHGKDFYTTETVESRTPEWNQEASIAVSGHLQEPVRFKVKDKDHTLGSVTVALSTLSSSPNKMWLPLQPYKKATVAHGSLHVGCWVTSYSERTTSLVDSHHQGSHGLQLHSPSIRHSNRGRDETGLHSDTNLQDTEEATEVPEVTGVSPNEGPVEGGQRVVLRGSYLGVSREDIVQVLVAGVDCTSSLEYFSSSKLAVVTESRAAPGSGPIVVNTQSGGIGVSWIKFSFTASRDVSMLHDKNDLAESAELRSYKQQVKELKEANKRLCEENEELHGYIDRLLMGVLTHSPGVLEVHSSPDSLRQKLTQ